MTNRKNNLSAGILITGLLLITLSACTLQPADRASLTVSAAHQFESRGYYGTINDVTRIDVYIYTTEANNLMASMTLDPDSGWTGEAPDIPTMTDLTIEAFAYGNETSHVYELIDWEVADTSGYDVLLFSGSTTKFISSAAASIYLALNQYDDGSLQRLPRINRMTSNLNTAELSIDFNDYGETLLDDGSSAYERWYWRIIDDNGPVSETSFSYEEGLPESSILFDEATTQLNQGTGSDITLSYLFPDDDGDNVTDWYNRLYWLEIANPQHNVLRQAFVMNPGADSQFDINFAPWIRNITAGRYYDLYDSENGVVLWQADVTDDTAGDIRYLWILKSAEYSAVYGSLAGTEIPAGSAYTDWSEWVSGITSALGTENARETVTSELGLILASAGTIIEEGTGADTDGSYPAAGFGPDKFSVNGSLFDNKGFEAELYLLAFDDEFGESNEAAAYAWSHVRMELDSNSFPAAGDGTNGLIVFEGTN